MFVQRKREQSHFVKRPFFSKYLWMFPYSSGRVRFCHLPESLVSLACNKQVLFYNSLRFHFVSMIHISLSKPPQLSPTKPRSGCCISYCSHSHLLSSPFTPSPPPLQFLSPIPSTIPNLCSLLQRRFPFIIAFPLLVPKHCVHYILHHTHLCLISLPLESSILGFIHSISSTTLQTPCGKE